MKSEPLVVIGVGPEGPATLSAEARDHIARARVLAGGKRLLDLFPDWSGERLTIDANLDRLIASLRERYRTVKTVVLASGDPLFYGIGKVLLDTLPRDDLVFLPHVSSVQLAFARLKQSWNDAAVVSVHGRPMENLLPALQRQEAKIAVLTDATNDPRAIAEFLRGHGVDGSYEMWVCQDLGGLNERVSRWPVKGESSPLNVVVLLRQGNGTAQRADAQVPLLGIPDHALAYRTCESPHRPGRAAGMFTHREVRVLTVAYLELHDRDILWDIGAGSGSVSVEASRFGEGLKVFAIEKDPQAVGYIAENVRTFGASNVQVVAGEAPEAFANLPDPDCAFIGGSGGRLAEILVVTMARLKAGGRLVLNCITLETFSRAWTWLAEHGLRAEATSVQLSHSRPLGSLHCFEPEAPIFILRVRKP